jgi:hypothetical protein
MTKELESWCRGIIRKRTPDAVTALMAVLNHARAHGQVSAADIDLPRFAEPNVIGAVWKLMRRCGLRKTGQYVKCAQARKHSREVPVWEVWDYQMLDSVVTQFRRLMLGCDPNGQGRFF